MTEKQSTDERIIEFLREKGTATVDEVCAALKIGRTSARKYLAGLKVEKKINRESGGRDGRRRLPDVFSVTGKPKPAGKRGKPTPAKPKNGRLGPRQLDKLVLDYMRSHRDDSPHTASAIAKGIKRSSGAVANCLGRQAKEENVRLVKPKPREYALVEGRK
jgi:predicted ArsR family transcriptional regulator